MVARTHPDLPCISGGADSSNGRFRDCTFYLYIVLKETHIHKIEDLIQEILHGHIPVPLKIAPDKFLVK